jgi:hypothetical protein
MKKIIFLYNFSILNDFFLIVSFFLNLILYPCSFFFSLKFFISKKLLELAANSENHSFFYNFSLFNLFGCHKILNSFFFRILVNYYMSDVFSKYSKIMMLCARKIR